MPCGSGRQHGEAAALGIALKHASAARECSALHHGRPSTPWLAMQLAKAASVCAAHASLPAGGCEQIGRAPWALAHAVGCCHHEPVTGARQAARAGERQAHLPRGTCTEFQWGWLPGRGAGGERGTAPGRRCTAHSVHLTRLPVSSTPSWLKVALCPPSLLMPSTLYV